MDETQPANQLARDALAKWLKDIRKNSYTSDPDFIHTMHFYFANDFTRINSQLKAFGEKVAHELEPLIAENHLPANLPRLESYDGIGNRIDKIVHHPVYTEIGNIIYGTHLLEKIAKPGGLLEGLALFFLSSEAGEAGHNCPIACSAGILRVFQKTPDFPQKKYYLEKLIAPSYQANFTGAQFLTEIQGGSDVGLNATVATLDQDNQWCIHGEKWFCSNANADLIFITARFDEKSVGTKGLGLFLIPAIWKDKKNRYTLRRLKDKLGTRSMATAEIDFHDAYAYPMGPLEDGIHLVMENVLHISRLFNTVCVLGMARRAYQIAFSYAQHRVAFSHPIIDYSAITETLARIKAENAAMLAGIFATIQLQDQCDQSQSTDENTKLLLRLLVNIQKYLSARWSVEHIHHALDILVGNGTIETFSAIPRLFRDSIVCENWEGTHNVLCAQVLRDINKYSIDQVYFSFMQSELNKLNDQTPYTKTLMEVLKKLEQHMLAFRQLTPELQTLQIRPIVDRMAMLYCASRLLFEALDQSSDKKHFSKLDCFHYFCLLHLLEQKITHDKNYLELIVKITSKNHVSTYI